MRATLLAMFMTPATSFVRVLNAPLLNTSSTSRRTKKKRAVPPLERRVRKIREVRVPALPAPPCVTRGTAARQCGGTSGNPARDQRVRLHIKEKQ
jgi:hypothetical protein